MLIIQHKTKRLKHQPEQFDSNINFLIEQAFTTLLTEEEVYVSKGSGFILESIDKLLLTVYK